MASTFFIPKKLKTHLNTALHVVIMTRFIDQYQRNLYSQSWYNLFQIPCTAHVLFVINIENGSFKSENSSIYNCTSSEIGCTIFIYNYYYLFIFIFIIELCRVKTIHILKFWNTITTTNTCMCKMKTDYKRPISHQSLFKILIHNSN